MDDTHVNVALFVSDRLFRRYSFHEVCAGEQGFLYRLHDFAVSLVLDVGDIAPSRPYLLSKLFRRSPDFVLQELRGGCEVVVSHGVLFFYTLVVKLDISVCAGIHI